MRSKWLLIRFLCCSPPPKHRATFHGDGPLFAVLPVEGVHLEPKHIEYIVGRMQRVIGALGLFQTHSFLYAVQP